MRPLPVRHIIRARHLRRSSTERVCVCGGGGGKERTQTPLQTQTRSVLRSFFIAPSQMPRSLDVSHWKRTHFVYSSLLLRRCRARLMCLTRRGRILYGFRYFLVGSLWCKYISLASHQSLGTAFLPLTFLPFSNCTSME